MNNDAFGVVSHNILRSCNLGVGAGPSGQLSSKGNSTPFVISNNLIASNAYGGIASFGGSDTDIIHNTIIGNAYGLSDFLTGGISIGDSGSESVYNNILTGNYYGLNCHSCGASWGDGPVLHPLSRRLQ